MHNAMHMQDRCETLDLSQNNSLVDGEDQLVALRGAVLGSHLIASTDGCWFQIVVVVVIPSRGTIAFPSRLIVAVSLVILPGTSPSVLLLF